MNISNNIFRNNSINQDNVSSKDAPVNRTDNTITVDLSSLQKSQMFSGTVTNVTGNNVSILLEGMNMLNAKLGEAVALNIGDELMFEVRENTGDTITIRPVIEGKDTDINQAILKALDSNGFMATQKNVQIATSLMNANEPLDKGTMLKIMQEGYKFSEASTDILVALNKMNMPITEGNINQYERYLHMEHQLNADISNMSSEIAHILENMGEASKDSLIQGSNQILSILGTDIEETGSITNNEWHQSTEKIEGASGNVTNNSEAQPGSIVAGNEADTLGELTIDNSKLTSDKDILDGLAGKLIEKGIPKEVVLEAFNQAKNDGNLLNKINNILQKSTVDSTKLQELFSSEEYKGVLENVVKKQWLIKPEDMKTSDEIKQQYERILNQSSKLMDTFSTDVNHGDLSKQGKNMQENINFINDMNNMYAYAQLPVKLDNGNGNSELYVYANKAKLAKQDGEISVLLHLDMDNLGSTDIHVSLHNKKVHARFYMEDNEAVDIVVENIEELRDKLATRGFSLSNEVVKREEKSSNKVLEEVLEIDKEQSVKRYTFDVRM